MPISKRQEEYEKDYKEAVVLMGKTYLETVARANESIAQAWKTYLEDTAPAREKLEKQIEALWGEARPCQSKGKEVRGKMKEQIRQIIEEEHGRSAYVPPQIWKATATDRIYDLFSKKGETGRVPPTEAQIRAVHALLDKLDMQDAIGRMQYVAKVLGLSLVPSGLGKLTTEQVKTVIAALQAEVDARKTN